MPLRLMDSWNGKVLLFVIEKDHLISIQNSVYTFVAQSISEPLFYYPNSINFFTIGCRYKKVLLQIYHTIFAGGKLFVSIRARQIRRDIFADQSAT